MHFTFYSWCVAVQLPTMRFGGPDLRLSTGVSLSDSSSVPPCPSSDGRASPGSAAGPDLPVRFSQCSIASNRDSLHDPWSGRSDDSGPLSPLGDAAAQTTLTSPMFRQRADKDRSFTASAPPGVRPPSNRQTPGAGWIRDGADDDDDAENGMDRANKISRIEPRRDALSTPVHPCPPLCAAVGCSHPPYLVP